MTLFKATTWLRRRKRRPIAFLVTAAGVIAATLLPATHASALGTQASALVANASALGAQRHGNAADPTLSPATGGNGQPVLATTSPSVLEAAGYSQHEFFFSGTASAYQPVPGTTLTTDGKWTVEPAATASYKSRMVVYEPSDPKKFSGTVVVEWFNVSAGLDAAPDWLVAHDAMIRAGDIYVGVSAQAVGVNALKSSATGDPVRYSSLSHPGDSYSYDIFSQAGQAIRDQFRTLFGAGYYPRAVLADGESQSAYALATYIDAVTPLADVFDGYLIHSRGATGLPLAQLPERPAIPVPPVILIRNDLRVPVLTFESESDLSILDYLPARQPDSPWFRDWEVPGTAHADAYGQVSVSDTGSLSADKALFGFMQSPPTSVAFSGISINCAFPNANEGLNAGETHYVLQTAVVDLSRWAQFGIAPPSMPRMSVNATPAGDFKSFNYDANGNVLGGVRTPAVDAPVAILSGLPATTGGFCVLFGSTTPFSAQQLAALYPTHPDFVADWTKAVISALFHGALLPGDAARLLAVVR